MSPILIYAFTRSCGTHFQPTVNASLSVPASTCPRAWAARSVTFCGCSVKPFLIYEDARARDAWKSTAQYKSYPKVTPEDIDKAFLALKASDPDTIYPDKKAFGAAMVAELEKLGADLTLAVAKVVPTGVKVIDPARPTETTEPILRAAVENMTGADNEAVDLTLAELHTLSEKSALGRIDRYVAKEAFTLLSREASANKGKGGGHTAPKLTLATIKKGKAEYDKDTSIDKSRELLPGTPEGMAFSTQGLLALLPTIHAKDKATFDEIDKLLNNRVTTVLTQALGQELTSAFILLDRYWMVELKPKARDALRGMVTKANEFAGMRGVVGEAHAAWYAAAMGRTDVSVSNDKVFAPDVEDDHPRAGMESQDVDVASNTATERFYTEAKYDMGTFLAKASESVEKVEKNWEKQRDESEKKRQKALAASSKVSSAVTTDPPKQPDRPLPPKTVGPDMKSPGQLYRYEKAATRTKKKLPVQVREKRLEVYIATSKDWLKLFDGHETLRKYLTDKRWRVVVETHDVMAVADTIVALFKPLRQGVLDSLRSSSSAKWINIDPWLVAFSSAVKPQDFVTISEHQLKLISDQAFLDSQK